MHRARLSTDQLLEVIPLDRVAYFHQRNLPAVWIEHSASLEAESRWHAILPDADFLGNPRLWMIRSIFRSCFMSIEHLVESIGMSAGDLKRYVLAEIDEFLEAKDPSAREEEFGDILFALMSMAWAHSGRHYALHRQAFEPKVKERLRRYATLARHPGKYLHDRIPELKFGVLHFAFGQFTGQWSEFDSLKNGTVAEIHLLTEAPFRRPDNLTNHCIITFDEIETIEYAIIDGASDTQGGNIVLCRIPDFMFRRARRELKFVELSEYLSLQVLAAIDGLQFSPGGVAHLYSWECGFLTDSEEFRSYTDSIKTIFSPGLTIGPLSPS